MDYFVVCVCVFFFLKPCQQIKHMISFSAFIDYVCVCGEEMISALYVVRITLTLLDELNDYFTCSVCLNIKICS